MLNTVLAVLIIFFVILVVPHVYFRGLVKKKMGKVPLPEEMKKRSKRSVYREERFENLPVDPVASTPVLKLEEDKTQPRKMERFKPIPTEPFSLKTLLTEESVTWFGHSTLFFRLNGLNILIDPLVGPVRFPLSLMVKNYPYTHYYKATAFGPIDVLLITHDHVDHLSYDNVILLKDRVKHFITALGVGARLQSFGIPAGSITELDWYESMEVEGVSFRALPAAHFSGRSQSKADHNRTLWASWIIKSPRYNFFTSGDSSYTPIYKEIGDAYGPFHMAFMESIALDAQWAKVHLYPEESVQAALDLKAKQYVPIHWGQFTLTKHHWKEPILRTARAIEGKALQFVTPRIGETIPLEGAKTTAWWNAA